MGERKRTKAFERGWKKEGFVGRVVVTVLFLLVVFGLTLSLRSSWSSEFNYSVVIVGENRLGLLVLDPVVRRAKLLSIPENMMVPVVGMKGELRSSRVWRFAKGEGKQFLITKRSVENFLGTRVEGVAYINDWQGSLEEIDRYSFLRPIVADLPMIDRLRIAFFVASLRSDQRRQIEVPLASGVLERLPDGTEVVVVDKERLEAVRKELVNELLLQSPLRLVVQNRSEVPAMAVLAERMIEGAGGLVATVEGGEESYPDWCKVSVAKENKKEILIRWLKTRLSCRVESVDREQFEAEVVIGKKFGEAYRR